ncbi:MAG: isochorismatase family protein, partial [Proteobacteria bacterium]|nr:isochorismatase family protein [Pseudomonadota bacterium]
GVHQNIDSYSGFFENDQLTATELGPYLKSINLTDLTIVGLATDYCVKYTALDAKKSGFNTTVLVDACRGVELNSGDVKKALEEMSIAGVNISSKELN